VPVTHAELRETLHFLHDAGAVSKDFLLRSLTGVRARYVRAILDAAEADANKDAERTAYKAGRSDAIGGRPRELVGDAAPTEMETDDE
jgi:hypothetical protein